MRLKWRRGLNGNNGRPFTMVIHTLTWSHASEVRRAIFGNIRYKRHGIVINARLHYRMSLQNEEGKQVRGKHNKYD